ncbi:MAG TPA: metallophosphoesterase [Alphaproteobacteria bacterium]|nr:metallophosphoesterase [Alphaproteobacteria bacterium]
MTDYWIQCAGQNIAVILDIAWWVIAMCLARKKIWRLVISLFMAVQLSCGILIAWGVDLSVHIPTAALTAVILWHFFGISALTGLGVLYMCHRMIRPRRQRVSAIENGLTVTSDTENSISRRDFIGACAALAPPLATFSITGIAMAQINEFRLRRFTLSLPSLPKSLDGVTIAHVSDVHVGQWTHGPILKKIVERTNAMNADLVVVTGDLINFELSDLSESIDLLKQMHGRYGLYMVEGNHDLLENGAEFERRVKQSGLSLLVDESTVCEVRGHPVQFLGLRWTESFGSPNDKVISRQVGELMKQRRPDAFPIFLAHHPHAFDAAAANGLPLTLTGHTHGGQLMLDKDVGVGPALFRYWSGLYKREQSQLIVSNGVGNMFPIRINAPAELVHITLRCA